MLTTTLTAWVSEMRYSQTVVGRPLEKLSAGVNGFAPGEYLEVQIKSSTLLLKHITDLNGLK